MLTVAVAVTVVSENVTKFNISLLYSRLGIIIRNNIYKLDKGKYKLLLGFLTKHKQINLTYKPTMYK